MDYRETLLLTGPTNPGMRHRLIRCPIVEMPPGTDPSVVLRAAAAKEDLSRFGTRCDRTAWLFYHNFAFCPEHGSQMTGEPWNDPMTRPPISLPSGHEG